MVQVKGNHSQRWRPGQQGFTKKSEGCGNVRRGHYIVCSVPVRALGVRAICRMDQPGKRLTASLRTMQACVAPGEQATPRERVQTTDEIDDSTQGRGSD